MRFSFKSITVKLILFFVAVGLGVLLVIVYLVNESGRTKRLSARVENIHHPVSNKLVHIGNRTNHYFSSLIENVTEKDTSGWRVHAGLQIALSDDIRFLKLHKNVFSVQEQHIIDSVETEIAKVQSTGDMINRWVIDNYLSASDDSAFQAELPSRTQVELIPLVARLERITVRLSDHLDDLRGANSALLGNDIASMRDFASRATWTGMGAGIVILFFLVIGGVTQIRRFRQSLKVPSEILGKLVAGETPDYVPPSQDEFGVITEAVNKVIGNLQEASHFAQSIGEGDVGYQFQPVSETDILGNSLVQMHNKLKSINEADRKNNWVSEGLATFANIMRKYVDYEALTDHTISELVKYTGSNQGGLFILNQDDEKNPYLHLVACYAYERKKFIERRVDTGQGLVGQCFLERRTIFLKEIPHDYLHITSGLGGSNPRSLILVPLKVNDLVEGVMELASFKEYEPHEIDFIEKVGEIIASTMASTRVNEQTRRLLEEAQQGSEEMRAQEEEMRQNMEEMQATQEQMQRQTDEMRKMQANLETEKAMFHVLMDFLPDRITYKDKSSRVTRINKAKAEKLGMQPEEVVGKTDHDFFSKEHADMAMEDERRVMASGIPILDMEERVIFSATGEVSWASTSRIPFRNDRNEVTGLFIVTKDVTDLKIAESSLKDREKIIEQLLDNMPVFRYTISRERTLQNLWKSNILKDLDLDALKNKHLKDCLPEIFDSISQEDLGDSDLVCKEVLEINGEKEVFKHHVFKDNAYDNVYIGFAIRQ